MLGRNLHTVHRLIRHGCASSAKHRFVFEASGGGGQVSNSTPDSAGLSEKPRTVGNDSHKLKIDLVEEVQKKLTLQDESIDCTHVPSIVRLLAGRKIPQDLIVEALTRQTALTQYDVTRWRDAIRMAAQSGFKKGQILQLLASQPDILSGEATSRDRFHQAMSTLRGLGFVDEHICRMITLNPDIVAVPNKLLVHNLTSLREVYREASTKASCRHHPKVLTQPHQAVENVLNYCHHEMGVDVKDTLKANAFVYSVEHTSMRHKFLMRSGLYERPNKHGVTSIENPSLGDILEMSDERFAVKVGKATLEEYEVFCLMLQQDKASEADAEDEDDEIVYFDNDVEDEVHDGETDTRN